MYYQAPPFYLPVQYTIRLIQNLWSLDNFAWCSAHPGATNDHIVVKGITCYPVNDPNKCPGAQWFHFALHIERALVLMVRVSGIYLVLQATKLASPASKLFFPHRPSANIRAQIGGGAVRSVWLTKCHKVGSTMFDSFAFPPSLPGAGVRRSSRDASWVVWATIGVSFSWVFFVTPRHKLNCLFA